MEDDIDYDAAMEAVVNDMGRVAHAARAKKFAPKPAPVVEKAPEPVAEDDGMPTADELAALIGE